MRYRLDVVAASVPEVVMFAGGWLVDRVMAGWDVTVLMDGAPDLRPLEILGVDHQDLETALQTWADRPHPQTVAVAADLFAADPRVRKGVLDALDQGLTEVTLWGEHCPSELDDTVGAVSHRLSAAARAFKAQALAAAIDTVGTVGQERSDRGIGTVGQERSDRGIGTVGQERSDGGLATVETFRCGAMIRPSVAADLIPAS